MNFYIFSPSFLARARSFSRIAVTSSSILTIKRSFCMKFIKKCPKIPEIFNSHQWYHQVFSATTKWHILECTTWSWELWTNRSNEPTTEIRSPSTWWVSIAQCWRWKRPKNHQKIIKKSQKKSQKTHKANSRRWETPAELPPSNWVIPNHVFNAIIESLNAKAPRHWNALKEDQEQQAEAADSVWIEDLEHVHSALSDTRESHQVANDADPSNEEFLSLTQ